MGTRHLIMVVKNSKPVIAQYGQWDGYPDGQGAVVLKFLKGMKRANFEKALENCRFGDNEETAKLWEIPKHRAFMTRDNGAKILSMVNEATDEVVLQDQSTFAEDSLMCEWVYVLDMDTDTLEVYEGFNEAPVPKDNRFQGEGQSTHDGGTTYYPVVKKMEWQFDNLPSEKEFIHILSNDEEDIDEDPFTRDAIASVIDHIRSGDHGNELVTDRICNFMDANIDEFIDCYEDVNTD